MLRADTARGGWRSEENLGGEAKQTTPSLLRREGRVPLLLREAQVLAS